MLSRKSVKRLVSTVLSIFTIFSLNIEAREPYHADVTVGADTERVSAPNIVNLVQELREADLEALFATYTPTSAAGINFNLRGLDAIAFFAAGSTTLTVSFPVLGEVETFTGSTRDESLKLYQEFIRNNGTRPRHVLQAYAKYTAIDPIAGNPNALLEQMGQADYLLANLTPMSGCECSLSAQPITHLFQAGAIAGRAFADGFDTTFVNIPLRYSYSFDNNALIIDIPATLLENGEAWSFYTSLGLGLRMPITNDWSLTSTVRWSVGGSVDLSTAGSFVATGLLSNYNFKICDYVLTVTDYVGYYTSTPLHLGGINFDYHLYNFVTKNGFSLKTCEGLKICGKPFNWALQFTDSYYFGNHLFIRHFDEVGITINTSGINPCLDFDSMALGFSYQFGEHGYHGYYFDFAYQF